MSIILNEKYYLSGYKKRDYSILARFISLIESPQLKHENIVNSIFKKIKSHQCYVLGISGTPGSGKSTLINQLGLSLLSANPKLKLAVVAIDPSSEITGGSILGDKTRMGQLAQHKRVYIRPIASKGSFGGVTPKIENILKAIAAWGFDMIVVETVGVGQSESSIRSLVDNLVLVVPPGTGDDLQAMKRGLLELIDVVCINKIDQSKTDLVESSYQHYKSTLAILRSKNIPVFLTNALNAKGIKEILKWTQDNFKKLIKNKKVKDINNYDNFQKMLVLDLQFQFSLWLKKQGLKLNKKSANEVLHLFAKKILEKND